MRYIELIFTINDTNDFVKDLLINELADIDFNTFEDTETGFKAYKADTDFNKEQIDEKLNEYNSLYKFYYEVNYVESQNWNKLWESNFEPVVIDGKVNIRATFHESRASEFPMEIIIDPKMAFGTGHHETTYLMSEFILHSEFEGKRVLDMGCGSGVLAILAAKLGASYVLAVDIDPICVSSTIENKNLNDVKSIEVKEGNIDAIKEGNFDIILANINRNILIDHLPHYTKLLSEDGFLLMSGFYENPDLSIIKSAAAECDLMFIDNYSKNNWAAAKFSK